MSQAPTDTEMSAALRQAATLLRRVQRPLLFCHRSPDGDTVGAALALARALRRVGSPQTTGPARGGECAPAIVCADPLPPSLVFLPESETIGKDLPPAPDVLVTIDISDPGMLGALRADFERLRAGRTLLNIDHHASDTLYGDLNVVDVTAASTAEIIYDLLVLLGVTIDEPMATDLLTGIINDTHSFQNANSSPRALTTAAALVAAGASPSLITYHLLLRRRPQAALLWGRTLATLRLDDDGRVASAVVTNEMLQECHAELADVDGIVEFLRNIAGVDLAFLLKQAPDGHFKASVRTTERVDAVALTAPFKGGGHRRAAGCDLDGPAEAARAALLAGYYELSAVSPQPSASTSGDGRVIGYGAHEHSQPEEEADS